MTIPNYKREILQSCKRLGITVKELGKRAKVNKQTLYNIVNGQSEYMLPATWDKIESAISKIEKGTKK